MIAITGLYLCRYNTGVTSLISPKKNVCICLHNVHYRNLYMTSLVIALSKRMFVLEKPKDNGYLHDGRADKNPYPHDRRADKDSYPLDSNNQCIILRLSYGYSYPS